MNIELWGRKAIVTGSTAGIGRATAEGLARAGASVVINGHGNARVDEAVLHRDAAGLSRERHIGHRRRSLDEGAATFFRQVPDADILVNNVGTAVLRDFADTTNED